jgi:hypothetical protein
MAPPRPLAGLHVPAPDTLARAWLVRRIADAPFAAASELAGPAFTSSAPSLCDALLEALQDDDALDALAAEGAALAALCPGGHAVRAAATVEQLRAATIEAVTPTVDAALLPALHDRLAHACSRLVGGVLDELPGETITVHDARPAADASVVPRRPGGPLDARAEATVDPRSALTAELERLIIAGVAFALLVVEIEDAAVLPRGLLATAEAAIGQALPAGARDAPDGPGSIVVLARDQDGRVLAQRLTHAVATAGSHRGAPLGAVAGVAEHPRDGGTSEQLLAHADGQLYVARADGLPLA